MGTNIAPRGLRNNNPLNIKQSPDKFKGEVTNIYETKFKTFKSMLLGFRAAFCILRTYIIKYSIRRINDIVHRWCPDDTAAAYVDFVCKLLDCALDKELSFYNKEAMVNLVHAMAQLETGVNFNKGVIGKAYDMCIFNR